jgi:hypothetical protein
MPSLPYFRHFLFSFIVLLAASSAATSADDKGWIDLTDLDSWRKPFGNWLLADSVGVDADNPRLLSAKPGKTILVNGPKGRERDLLSKQDYGDLEVHVEFLVAKGSNSGVKLQGLYEIQIQDSWGVKQPKGSDCGGIYPRAELKPKYHYLDKGVPPRSNACKKPGEWQTLDIVFQAPRFDAAGMKTASARFVQVVLNGEIIHENVEARTPTGHAWTKKEVARGPLLLQGDHGPVAFKNVRVRPYTAAPKKD